jgi:hypothetical protein
MVELAKAQVRTQQNLDQLSREMREFKDDRLAADTRLDRRWGELANKMGTLAEDIVAPGIPAIFQRAFGHTMLGLSRGLMEILNSPDFRPREF